MVVHSKISEEDKTKNMLFCSTPFMSFLPQADCSISEEKLEI